MDAIHAIIKRRSVRSFLDTPIPKKIIKQLINCARLAPTARNIQPWEFIVLTDKLIKERTANLTDYGKFLTQAPLCIAVFCKDTKYYLEDGCAATQNLLIAATNFGLGSCWVAGDKKLYAESINQILAVPTVYKLVSLIAIGYNNKRIAKCKKRTVDNVLHWNKF